jgi:hypothetical protein
MSDLLNKMMEANKLTNEQAKADREARLEAKRHELAGAMTRMMVNEALGRVQQAKQENEALAEKARAEKK